MRVYLVVLDESPEAEVALRFAARRAAKTGGGVRILAITEKVEFLAVAGAQATMEAEARERAEALVHSAAGTILAESGITPTIDVRSGDPVAAVRAALGGDAQIASLVLGAAAEGAPGPLVSHFACEMAGSLPCPVMVIPGSLTRDALDRLS